MCGAVIVMTPFESALEGSLEGSRGGRTSSITNSATNPATALHHYRGLNWTQNPVDSPSARMHA